MLWIPGPTEVRPEVLEECARPMIGHRSPAMGELIERMEPHLPLAFGAQQDAHYAVATSSATGLMEAALRGVGPRTLSIVNGAFSKRWYQIACDLGKQAQAFDVEWGAAADPAKLREHIAAHGPFDAVTVVANETSTGVRTHLKELSACLREFPDTLLLVDAVTLLAAAPVDFDADGLDFALAGTQKALALPPGLALCCASKRYMESARRQENRGWYLDPVRLIEGHAQRKTPTTPAIGLYYALARQLEDISSGVALPQPGQASSPEQAWRSRFDKHERMRDATLAWGQRWGFEPFPKKPVNCSPSVSCLQGESFDIAQLCADLKERGFEISNGYGPLKNRTFRIGHMGDHTEHGLQELLSNADTCLEKQSSLTS